VCRRAGGGRRLASTRIEGNDRRDRFGLEKLIDAVRIEATIIDSSPHGDRHGMGRTGFQEAVQTGRPHREVRHMARGDHDMDG
jgi:hypothetical protein